MEQREGTMRELRAVVEAGTVGETKERVPCQVCLGRMDVRTGAGDEA